MTSFRHHRVLILSHLTVALLGLIGGYAYDHHRGPIVDTFLESLAEYPQSEAAALAYRFGTAEHARSLLLALPVPVTQDKAELAGLFFRYLRVAVVCNEQGDLSCEDTYLALARQTCDRRDRTPCRPDKVAKALDIVKKPRNR